MKTKTINITKYAAGPKAGRYGDDILCYSEGVSERSKDLNGLFLDNPVVLSPHHASLVWRYYDRPDTYMLIHVQGSQVGGAGETRSYAFRAGYEVSRSDMDAINFDLAALVQAVPRYGNMEFGKVDAATVVEYANPITTPLPGSETLAKQIVAAILRGRRLMVAVQPPGDSWRTDAIFECKEFKTLFSAISQIAPPLRRYATFGFCVDENFAPVLDGVQLVFYREGCAIMRVAGDTSLTWEQAVTQNVKFTEADNRLYQQVVSAKATAKPMTLDELRLAADVSDKDSGKLTGDEWDAWLALGHKLNELDVHSWKVFGDYCQRMSSSVRNQLAAAVRDEAVTWNLTGLKEEWFTLVNFSDSQQKQLQKKALKAYLESDKREYDFLFPNGVTNEICELMDDNFVRSLNVADGKSVTKWVGILDGYQRMSDDRVRDTMADLLVKYVLPTLKKLSEVVAFMKRNPFISYQKYRLLAPAIDCSPSQKDLDEIGNQNRGLVEEWIAKAGSKLQINHVSDILKPLKAVAEGRGINPAIQARLNLLQTGELAQLLAQSGKDGLRHAEELLEIKSDLPKDYAGLTGVIEASVNAYLLDVNGPWSDDYACNPANWCDLAQSGESHPEAFKLLKTHLASLFERLDQLKRDEIMRYFTPVYSLTDGATDALATQQYNDSLTMGNLIVKLYVRALKRVDSDQASALTSSIKGRRGGGNWPQLSPLVAYLACFLLGCLLTSVVWWKWGPGSKEVTVIETTTQTYLYEKGGKNLMLCLADVIRDGYNGEIKADSLTLKVDSMLSYEALAPWHSCAVSIMPPEATARIHFAGNAVLVSRQEISKTSTLFEVMRDNKIDTVAVMGNQQLIIAIPDSVNKAHTGVKNYLDVICYIDSLLPSQIKNKFPY